MTDAERKGKGRSMSGKAARAFLIIIVAIAAIVVVVFTYTVIRDMLASNIKISVPENITVAELYDMMQAGGEFELPYALGEEGAIEYILFPLDGNNVIKVTAEGREIQVYTTKDNWWRDIGTRQLTRQWSNIIDSYEGDYQPLLENIAAEIRRLTGGE